MRRLFWIGVKDVTALLRDFPALAILLGMPIVLIAILGSALGGAMDNPELGKSEIAIVDQDGDEISLRITEGFTESEEIGEIFIITVSDDLDTELEKVEKGDLAGVLVIPKGFSTDVEDAVPVELGVFVDPGNELTGSILRGISESIANQISGASVTARTTQEVLEDSKMVWDPEEFVAHIDAVTEAASSGDALNLIKVDLEEADLVPTEENTYDPLDFYAGGMSVMFLLFGAMFGAFSLSAERRQQTLPRLMITPAHKYQIVGGKMFGIFCAGLVQFAVLFGFTLFMGVSWGSSSSGLALVILSTIAAVTGLSIFISALAKTERQVGALGPIIIQLMALAGGSFFPIWILPEWLQPIRWFTVNGWALDAIGAMQRGAGIADVWVNALALLGMGGLFFAVGVWRLSYE